MQQIQLLKNFTVETCECKAIPEDFDEKKTSNLARAGPINSWKKCAKFPVILELNLHQKNQEGNMFTMCSQVKQGCCEKLWHF